MALYDDQALIPEQQAPPPAAAAQSAPAPAASPEPGSETKPMPAAQEPSYGVGAAIVDAISHRLGFGTPIRSIENQRLAENSQRLESERSQALLDATRMKEAEDEFTKVSAPVFLAVGKPKSPYYKDSDHFAQKINESEKAKAFIGGELLAAKTDKTHENGDPIWKYGIRDPKTGKITGEFEDTTEGAMNRFEAALRPQVSALVRANIMKENAEQENKVAILRSNMNRSVAEKKLRGIDVTPLDRYLDGVEFRSSLPPEQAAKISDWMILDAAGLKQEREWDIDGRTVPNEDGTYSYAKINKRTGDVKWEKIPGSSWKEHKKGTAADVEKAKAAYWPHDPEAPQHVNNARALFFAAIDGEQDPNKQRYMLNTVMPDFKDWAMEHSGEVDAVDKDGKKIKKPLSNKETRKWLEEAMKGYGGTPAAGGKAGQADPKADKTPYLQDLHAQALKKQEAVPPEPPSVAGSESRKGLGAMRGDEAVEAVKEKLKSVKLVGPGMMERKRYQQPNE